MNTPLYALVGTMEQAGQLKSQLLGAGIRQRAIRMLSLPMPERDHMGGFADRGDHAHTPERDHVGGFADRGDHAHTPERDHMGGFADRGDHAHTPERDHVGSFAPHLHADDVLRELTDAGVPSAEAARCVDRMRHGAMLLLVNADGQLRMAAQGILQSA